MAYIGSIPAYQASGVRPRDEFTADGTQICFPLSQSVPGSFESGVTIVLDNVPQQPVEAFTVVDTRTLTLTSISGTFTVNETITGATSAATGTVLKVNLNNIVIRGLTGTFSSSEGITGGTSAATATTTSVTINTGSGILFSEAPTAASILYVVHEGNATYNLVPTAASVGPSQLADNLRNFTVDTFTGDGTTTTFTLSDTPSSANSLLVMVDGIVQTRTTNYTLSGAVVTFTDAPDSSAAITIIHLGFSTISRTGLVDGSVTTSKIADNAITSAKLGFDVIVAEDIAANAITVAEIANGAVTPAKLSTGGLYWDTSSNVGIGTTSPSTQLQVNSGATTYSDQLRIRNTNYGNADIGVGNGIMALATDMSNIAFYTSSSLGTTGSTVPSNERMRIDDSGKVGIGTTTMTNRLNVAGAVQSSSTLVAVEANTVALSQEATYSRLAAFGPNSSTGGTLYLYSISSNGAVQNGMIIDPAGRVTKPSQPYCFVGKSNGNVSAQNTIIFNDITANVGSHYNSSNGRFTAPVTGYYFISLNILGTSSSGVEASIRKNGSVVLNSRDAGGTSNYVSTAASTVISMSANDYLTVYVEGSYGANGDSGSGYTSMTAYLLG